MSNDDIYNVGYVEKLFDEMAGTYESVNYLTSFGFSSRWRRQFVEHVALRPGMTVYDLMCGMGECWGAIAAHIGSQGQIIGVDLSAGMLRGAEKRRQTFRQLSITLHKHNALTNGLPDSSADCVISGFGLKTFSVTQLEALAVEIKRLLKPSGTYSLIEVSVPHGWWLKDLYLFYLRNVIPLLGRVLLGNPENYRMLGVYTERFGDCRAVCDIFARCGLTAYYHRYFFGCATGVSGGHLHPQPASINPAPR